MITIISSLMPILTVGLGAVAAFFLQQRQWSLRRDLELREKRTEVARALFEEISRLLDKRLYCLFQLMVWTKRNDSEMAKQALMNYREVVRDWNYALSRNISMLHVSYGATASTELDSGVGRRFVEVGSLVERFHRAEPGLDVDGIDDSIEKLYADVSAFNLRLLEQLFGMENSAGLRGDVPLVDSRLRELPDLKGLLSVRSAGSGVKTQISSNPN